MEVWKFSYVLLRLVQSFQIRHIGGAFDRYNKQNTLADLSLAGLELIVFSALANIREEGLSYVGDSL
jgi:hypothetical protein